MSMTYGSQFHVCLLSTYCVLGTMTHKPHLLDHCSPYYATHCFPGRTESIRDLKSVLLILFLKSKITIMAESLKYERK